MSMAVFTRKVKEKVGLAEKTEDNPQVTEQNKRVLVINNQLKKLVKHLDKSSNSMQAIAESGSALSNVLVDFHVSFRDDTDRYLMAGALERVGEFQRKLEDVRLKLVHKVKDDIAASLQKLIDTEIKEAVHQKAANDKLRVDLANAQDKVATAKRAKKDKDIQKAELEEAEKKRQFETHDKETVFKLKDTVDVTEYQTLDFLCNYIEEHRLFFQRGSQYLNEMMTDIYDYRRYVDEKRQKLKDQAAKAAASSAHPTAADRMSKRQSFVDRKSVAVANPNKLFGTHLDELIARGAVDGVPKFLVAVVKALEQEVNITEEGIFRMAGSKTEVNKLKVLVDQGNYDFASIDNPHNIVDLLKSFLRDLPEPLMTYKLYSKFLDTRTKPSAPDKIKHLQEVTALLPPANLVVFNALMALLHKTSQRTKQNKMSPVTLATCIAPNILTTQELLLDPFEQTAQHNAIVSFIIQHYEEIFLSAPVSDKLGEAGALKPIAGVPASFTAVPSGAAAAAAVPPEKKDKKKDKEKEKEEKEKKEKERKEKEKEQEKEKKEKEKADKKDKKDKSQPEERKEKSQPEEKKDKSQPEEKKDKSQPEEEPKEVPKAEDPPAQTEEPADG